MRHRSAPIIAIVVLSATVAVAPARAGTYTHWSCHGPDGSPLPTDGWQRSAGTPDAPAVTHWLNTLHNQCNEPLFPSGDLVGLSAQLAEGIRAPGFVAWRYATPGELSVTRYRLHRRLEHNGEFGLNFRTRATIWHGAPVEHNIAESTNPRMAIDRVGGYGLQEPAAIRDSGTLPANVNEIYVGAQCVGDADGRCDIADPGREAHLGPYVASADVGYLAAVIEDSSAPVVSKAAGPLTAGGSHRGIEEVRFDATDLGAGLYRAVAQARIHNDTDWTTLATTIVDPNGGACADAGFDAHDDYEFIHQIPCSGAARDATLSVNTARLPAGTHALRVYVEDAAGNRAAVIGDRPFAVAEPSSTSTEVFRRPLAGLADGLPATNGVRASDRAIVRLKRPVRTIRHGHATTLHGSLVDEHEDPITAATITVQHRPLVPKTGIVGASWQTLGTVQTTKDGTFGARIASGPSRALRFVYKANPAQPGNTDAAEAQIRVRAGISARVARSNVRNGDGAVFVGRVAGAIPRGGVIVVLQAFTGRGWTPAKSRPNTARAGSDGRFRLSYRFTRTFRPTRYRFRIVVQEDSRFEYARAASRTIHVLVTA